MHRDSHIAAGLVTALVRGIQDENDRVRRRYMATLGELLFYVSSQGDKLSPCWQVPPSVVGAIIRLLGPHEDEVTQVRAALAHRTNCRPSCWQHGQLTALCR